MDLPPISIVDYSKDRLIELIRIKTGWEHRSSVEQKRQLTYLDQYLISDHVSAKTMVIESDYIDRHYIEDYSEYYARCFNRHPRKCARVHFFSAEFTEKEFLVVLNGPPANKDGVVLDRKILRDKYLGFFVIRPIPHTFMAKLCLAPYGPILRSAEHKMLTRKIRVSIAGLGLSVKTIAFQEQDKVVAACATSAIWMFLNASKHMSGRHVPSPSAITKSSSGDNIDSFRVFPSSGLSVNQISRSIKNFGLEPDQMACKLQAANSINCIAKFKELVYSYINNGIPVLLGGTIYERTGGNSDPVKKVGSHLICVLGYKYDPGRIAQTSEYEKEIFLHAHSLDRLYAHDDRHGPFIKLSLETVQVKDDNKEDITPLKLSIYKGVGETSHPDEFFSPDVLIVGLYHKIRITYDNILDICKSFVFHVNLYIKGIESLFKDESKELCVEEKEFIADNIKNFKKIADSCWDIALFTVNDIKKEVILSSRFLTFNGSPDKQSILYKNLPKYIWRARLYLHRPSEVSRTLVTDLLFDATEIPQAKVFIGYISYNNRADSFWKVVEKQIKSNAWDKFTVKIDENIKQAVNSITEFFLSNSDDFSLNTLFGYARLPNRLYSPDEVDTLGNIQKKPNIQVIQRGAPPNFDQLEKTEVYLWVINTQGNLCIGKERSGEGKNFGHPTLVDGKPARLAGELSYKQSKWVINLKSRTYSSHIERESTEAKVYLENVKKYCFNEEVDVEY